MLKTAARIALLIALITAQPASAQLPAVIKSGPVESLAWRGFQACLQISRGAPLEKAAAEAGFGKTDEAWVATVEDRALSIELATPSGPPGAKACLVVSRGPLPDHEGFGKRLAGWAGKEGLSSTDTGVTPGGGQMVHYATPDGDRVAALFYYPETGNPDQPTRSILLVGWTTTP